MDWAPGLSSVPTRAVWKMSWVQNSPASVTSMPVATVHTNVNAATNTAPHLRCWMSRTTKNAGVSLSPAASPVPMPGRRFFGRKSRQTSPMRNRLICPKYSVPCTGPVHSTKKAVSRATPRFVSEDAATTPASTATLAIFHATPSASDSWNQEKTTAANGG